MKIINISCLFCFACYTKRRRKTLLCFCDENKKINNRKMSKI